MTKTIRNTLIQASVIVLASAVIAAGTNQIRSKGIPLVTDIPYEIFAPCKDSEVASTQVTDDELVNSTGKVLYVDARPKAFFDAEHVQEAINVPYSALFGAAKEDIARVSAAAKSKGAKSVIVYGEYEDPASPGEKVDFGKPLADQLLEEKVVGVKYVAGGLTALNTKGITTVKGEGGPQ